MLWAIEEYITRLKEKRGRSDGMKVCKVKPDSSVCSGCYDTAIMFGGKISCKDCNKEE